MSSTTLEIITGLSQAVANAYDGSHDERFSYDGEERRAGLKREKGCPIMDKRVNDGFSVKFYADSLIINYQSDVLLRDLKDPKYDQEIERMINEIKKFLQREYKAVTGKSVSLRSKGKPQILAQTVSRVRSFVNAHQHFKISGMEMEPVMGPSIDITREVTRKFLEQFSDKRPPNDTRPKGDS
mgnify:FL=1